MTFGKLFQKHVFVFLSCLAIIMLVGCRRNHRNRNATSGGIQTSRYRGATYVPLQFDNGTYSVQVKVNDVPMQFIFDTGASTISISKTEALFLYKQGTLTDDDVIGSSLFVDAQGEISEETLINLRRVEIGNRKLENITASIVPNLDAPLLLGQSFLQKFGKISIDNEKSLLIIE